MGAFSRASLAPGSGGRSGKRERRVETKCSSPWFRRVQKSTRVKFGKTFTIVIVLVTTFILIKVENYFNSDHLPRDELNSSSEFGSRPDDNASRSFK